MAALNQAESIVGGKFEGVKDQIANIFSSKDPTPGNSSTFDSIIGLIDNDRDKEINAMQGQKPYIPDLDKLPDLKKN